MHRTLLLAGFAAGLLTSTEASAMPRFVYQLQQLPNTASPIHLFALAGIFFVIFIFGRYLEWSAMLTLGSALLCGLCVGIGGVWAITSDFMKSSGARTTVSAPPPPQHVDPPAETASATEVVFGAGNRCNIGSDCPSGTACAMVAGQKHCWQPCGEGDACPSGYTCFSTDDNKRVCAR
jgi:hypothetical protein